MYCSQCGNKLADATNFCPSCGLKVCSDVSIAPISKGELNPDVLVDRSSLVEITSAIHCQFIGTDANTISRKFSDAMGVNAVNKIKFNLYASKEIFSILPVSKDKSGLMLWGLLLGSGGLAAVAMEALDVVAKKLESRNANIIMKQDNPFFNALVFKSNSLELKVKEQRARAYGLSDLFKKETWFLISGNGIYQNNEYLISVKFGYEGQVSNPNKKRLVIFDKIADALNLEASKIFIGNKYYF